MMNEPCEVKVSPLPDIGRWFRPPKGAVRRVQPWDTLARRALYARPIAVGERTSEYSLAGDCEAPMTISVLAATNPGVLAPPETAADFVAVQHVRCRKCKPCLRSRQRQWVYRIAREVEATPGRTWFVTLTVDPKNRALAGSARDPAQAFAHVARWLGTEVQKYLKRLRKSGAALRYIAVVEPHKDGYPHMHILVHETGAPIRKKSIQAGWTLGFSSAKLADEGARSYIAKYLTKTAGRLRASLKYGLNPRTSKENVRETIDPLPPKEPIATSEGLSQFRAEAPRVSGERQQPLTFPSGYPKIKPHRRRGRSQTREGPRSSNIPAGTFG